MSLRTGEGYIKPFEYRLLLRVLARRPELRTQLDVLLDRRHPDLRHAWLSSKQRETLHGLVRKAKLLA